MKRKQPMCILTMNSWHSIHENQVFLFISQKTEVSYEGSQVHKGQILNWWTPVPWILRSHTHAEMRVLLKKKRKNPHAATATANLLGLSFGIAFLPSLFFGGGCWSIQLFTWWRQTQLKISQGNSWRHFFMPGTPVWVLLATQIKDLHKYK